MSFREKYQEFFEQLDPEQFNEEKFVPAVGDQNAEIVLIGEAPGANEVEQKEPFVGRAGKKLDKLLNEIGIRREELYITNLVKIRPPDNRNPKRNEIEAWKPLLNKELENIQPEIILTLGNFPSKELIDTSKGITEIHGEYFQKNGWKIMPVYHPAATLYDQSKTPVLREDLKKAFGKENSGQKTLKDL